MYKRVSSLTQQKDLQQNEGREQELHYVKKIIKTKGVRRRGTLQEEWRAAITNVSVRNRTDV
jgi:hypothetical protein